MEVVVATVVLLVVGAAVVLVVEGATEVEVAVVVEDAGTVVEEDALEADCVAEEALLVEVAAEEEDVRPAEVVEEAVADDVRLPELEAPVPLPVGPANR